MKYTKNILNKKTSIKTYLTPAALHYRSKDRAEIIFANLGGRDPSRGLSSRSRAVRSYFPASRLENIHLCVDSVDDIDTRTIVDQCWKNSKGATLCSVTDTVYKKNNQLKNKKEENTDETTKQKHLLY